MSDKDHQNQLEALADQLNAGSLDTVRAILQAMHPAEIADALESLPTQRRRILWALVDAKCCHTQKIAQAAS